MPKKLIDFDSFEVKYTLPRLLKDRTTNKNIIWATDNYESLGEGFEKTSCITEKAIKQIDLKPRVEKTREEQKNRTKSKAEVFTPSWVCNHMNNQCDEIWFGRKDVFNKEIGKEWEITKDKIKFPLKLNWYDYVQSRRLEITCGEAPYIISRYDTSSGNIIPIEKRIGILDRKIRIITENIKNEEKWVWYVMRAYKNIYAYEFQGDNLLLARLNLLLTFVEYLDSVWHRRPTNKELDILTNIIIKNIWQMDGLTGCPPFLEKETEYTGGNNHVYKTSNLCKIYDWQNSGKCIYFAEMGEE